MRGWPTRELAEQFLAEGERRNPGAWGNHSRVAAGCAEAIAVAAGMDGEKAYVLALLHDIGRRFGTGHLRHVDDGYRYMTELGFPDAARICLTHSFPIPTLAGYIGNRDIPAERQKIMEDMLSHMTYDDYDRLIQLCDCLAGSDAVVDMEVRMADVKARYGSYPPEKWEANFALRRLFEEKTGKNIYEIINSAAVF